MNRQFKFRAWDEELTLMRFFSLYKIHRSSVPTAWKLMQYTGLKDKNRKDIYEGDILKWEDGAQNTQTP
jgi:uncharacterized phage protein (TIGR01671 family)